MTTPARRRSSSTATRVRRPSAVPDYLKEIAYIDFLEAQNARLQKNSKRARKRFIWTALVLLAPWALSLLGVVPILGGVLGAGGTKVGDKVARAGERVGNKVGEKLGVDVDGFQDRLEKWSEESGVRAHTPRWGPAFEASKGFADPRSPYANLTLEHFGFIFRDPWDALNIPKTHPAHPLSDRYIGNDKDLPVDVDAEIWAKADRLSEPWETDLVSDTPWTRDGSGKYHGDVAKMARLYFKKAAKEIVDKGRRSSWADSYESH